jgi:hypothetical protein
MITGVQPKIELSQEDLYPKKYKIIRERDGLTKTSNEIKWLEFETDGRFKSSHPEPKVNRALMMGFSGLTYIWMTTLITEIIESKEDYVKFKTENSVYELIII